MADQKRIPTGRLTRLTQMARVGARSGASILLSKGSDAAATQAAEVLGSLRGLATKVGQMASYIDGFVPEAHREAYEGALSRLRDAAPSSSPEASARQVEEELGAPLDTLFTYWEPEPFASASIGQVHRARLADGRDVAVKVQHPGIAEAVDHDLQNAQVVERLVRTLNPGKLNSEQILGEIVARLREELDYGLEAEHQRRFAELHRGDPYIRIPDVVESHSSRRVLTTTLAHGTSLERAGQQDIALRRHYAEVLWRFVFKGNLVAGLFNADPHPGNYLFAEDGSIVFLDFGCVQRLTPHTLEHARGAHVAALSGDDAAFVQHVARLAMAQGGDYERDFVAYIRRCLAPLLESPYRVTRAYVASLVDGIQSLKWHAFKRGSGFVPLPEGTVWLNRLQFGFLSVLARLDVEVDYASVERTLLREAGLM